MYKALAFLVWFIAGTSGMWLPSALNQYGAMGFLIGMLGGILGVMLFLKGYFNG